ncbi:MAG: hypothetical protein M3N14_09995 [Bacteroidota bacterium]|nr:hypothetical protein [Bacteroidota bacterium]
MLFPTSGTKVHFERLQAYMMDEKEEFILKYFRDHTDSKAQAPLASPKFTETDVEQLIGLLVKEGYLILGENGPGLTEKGRKYVENK